MDKLYQTYYPPASQIIINILAHHLTCTEHNWLCWSVNQDDDRKSLREIMSHKMSPLGALIPMNCAWSCQDYCEVDSWRNNMSHHEIETYHKFWEGVQSNFCIHVSQMREGFNPPLRPSLRRGSNSNQTRNQNKVVPPNKRAPNRCSTRYHFTNDQRAPFWVNTEHRSLM